MSISSPYNILYIVFSIVLAATRANSQEQKTGGPCSPAIANVKGNVAVYCDQASPKFFDSISFNYLRIFGAMEASIVVDTWNNDGIPSVGTSDKLKQFLSRWEFSRAKPLHNPLLDNWSDVEYLARSIHESTVASDG